MDKICKIDGCDHILKKTEGKICQMHRSRWFRHKTYDISPNWPNLKKGKPYITKYGYVRVNIDGKRVLQHIYVMEQFLGRKLTKHERIHHLNGDKTDNDISNLKLFVNQAEHMSGAHSDFWRRRKINPPYSVDDIHNIVNRVFAPYGKFDRCFCGKIIEARNLCPTHYTWAFRHKLFTY